MRIQKIYRGVIIFVCFLSFLLLPVLAEDVVDNPADAAAEDAVDNPAEDAAEDTVDNPADAALIYGEFYFLQTFSSGEDNFDSKDSIGFEVYKKFSGEYGDWGEGDLQFRMQYSPLKTMIVTPLHSDFPSIGQPVIHNAFFIFKGNQGKNNIKIGHFDVPFGLEPELDTHPTLLQTLHQHNFGYVKDWGISMGGQLDKIDYEIALTTGSGNDFILGRDNYLVSGRIANPTYNQFRWGISGAVGNTLREGESVSLWRGGFDVQYYYAQWTFKGEVYGGETGGHPSYGALGEIDYTFPGQKLELELQFQDSTENIDLSDSHNTALILGLTYKLSQSWSFRTAYSHYFNEPSMDVSRDQVGIQFYYYGKYVKESPDK